MGCLLVTNTSCTIVSAFKSNFIPNVVRILACMLVFMVWSLNTQHFCNCAPSIVGNVVDMIWSVVIATSSAASIALGCMYGPALPDVWPLLLASSLGQEPFDRLRAIENVPRTRPGLLLLQSCLSNKDEIQ